MHPPPPLRCLQRKGFYFNPSTTGSTKWTISIEGGTCVHVHRSTRLNVVSLRLLLLTSAHCQRMMPLGGWCYDEQECLSRSKMALGSSNGWAKTGGTQRFIDAFRICVCVCVCVRSCVLRARMPLRKGARAHTEARAKARENGATGKANKRERDEREQRSTVSSIVV